MRVNAKKILTKSYLTKCREDKMQNKQIAEQAGVSLASVEKYMSIHGLTKTKVMPKVSPASVLTHEYFLKHHQVSTVGVICEETGFSDTTVYKFLKKFPDIELVKLTCVLGSEHFNWKTGIDASSGYRHIRVNGGYQPEHRLVMEQFLGIKLNTKQVVHHMNDNKLDNRICNLFVMNNKLHNKYHQLCFRRGIDTTQHTIADIIEIIQPHTSNELKMYAELVRIF